MGIDSSKCGLDLFGNLSARIVGYVKECPKACKYEATGIVVGLLGGGDGGGVSTVLHFGHPLFLF